MPVGIGGIGDIIALINILRGFVAALDGSRGSAAAYQEVKHELEGLEAALECYQQLLTDKMRRCCVEPDISINPEHGRGLSQMY